MIYLLSNSKQLFTSTAYQECNVNDVINWLNANKIIEFDTETSGLEVQTSDVLCYQFGNADNQFIIDYSAYPLFFFKDYFNNPEYLWIGQNIKFDLKFLIKDKINIWNINVYDTMLAECLLTAGLKNTSVSLLTLVNKYCGKTLDKSVRGEINRFGLTERVVKYAAGDVTYLSKIMRLQLKEILKQDLEEVLNLEMQVTKIFAEMEYNGLQLNQEKWKKAALEGKANATKLHNELDDIVLQHPNLKKFKKKYVQTSMFDFVERQVLINYNSPLQIACVLEALNINTESTDAKELEKFKHIPFILKFIEYKKQQKLITTYGENVLKVIRPDGSITTSFWQIQSTGRVSSGDKKQGYPNLQNLPATDTYRNPFEVDKDEVLIDADFSGMEAVITAELSNEENWIKANNDGLDLHSINAEMVYKNKWKDTALEDCEYYLHTQKCKCPEHKEMRQKVKTTTYLYLFGGGASKLSKQMNITKREAQTILNDFESSVPKLKAVISSVRQFTRRNLYIRTMKPFMRRRYFEDYSKMADEDKSKYLGELDRQSFNAVPQGSGADCTKQAMIYIKEELTFKQIPHKFRLQVHDSIMLSTPKEYGEQVKEITVNNMIKAGALICKKAHLGAEAYIGTYWQK